MGRSHVGQWEFPTWLVRFGSGVAFLDQNRILISSRGMAASGKCSQGAKVYTAHSLRCRE